MRVRDDGVAGGKFAENGLFAGLLAGPGWIGDLRDRLPKRWGKRQILQSASILVWFRAQTQTQPQISSQSDLSRKEVDFKVVVLI